MRLIKDVADALTNKAEELREENAALKEKVALLEEKLRDKTDQFDSSNEAHIALGERLNRRLSASESRATVLSNENVGLKKQNEELNRRVDMLEARQDEYDGFMKKLSFALGVDDDKD